MNELIWREEPLPFYEKNILEMIWPKEYNDYGIIGSDCCGKVSGIEALNQTRILFNQLKIIWRSRIGYRLEIKDTFDFRYNFE